MGLFDNIGQAVKNARRALRGGGGGRSMSVAKRDRIADMFGCGPQQIGAATRGAVSGDWDAFGDLCAIFDRYLLTDGHLRAEYEKRRGAAIQWPFDVVASEADPNGEQVADELRAMIENFSRFRRRVLYEMTDAIGKGVAFVELLGEFNKSTSRIELTGAAGVPQFALKQNDAGEWLFKASTGWEPVPVGKLLVYDRESQGSVLAAGLMYPLVWLALFKNFSLGDWVAFLEVYGVPLRIGKYPANFDDESPEVLTLVRAVMNVASDAGAVIPKDMEIEFIESARKGTSDAFEQFASFCNKEISKVLTGGTLTTDAGEKGARQLGDVHQNALDQIGAADADDMAEAIDELLRLLTILNHGERAGYPKFVFNTQTTTDRTKRLFELQGAVNAGLPVGVGTFYRDLQIEEPEPDELLVVPSSTMQNPGGGDVSPTMTSAAIAPAARVGHVGQTPEQVLRAAMEQRVAEVFDYDGRLSRFDSLAGPVRLAFDELQRYADGQVEPLADQLVDVVDAFADKVVDGNLTWSPDEWANGDEPAALLRAALAATIAPAMTAALLSGYALTVAENESKLPAGLTVDVGRVADDVIAQIAANARAVGVAPRLDPGVFSLASNLATRPVFSRPPGRWSAFAAIHFDFATPAATLEREVDGAIAWHAVKPSEALDYWARVSAVTFDQFEQLDAAAQQYAFTIAGDLAESVVATARDEIERALADGSTERDFAKALRAAAKREGVAPVAPWRAELVFRQNIATAQAAGRYAVQRSPEMARALPMLKYHGVTDKRERATHRALNGTVKPINDEFWKTYYPPWGWRCRCWVTSETAQADVDPPYNPPVDESFAATNPLTFWRQTAGLE